MPGLAISRDVALLGIDLATRRRNRANGTVIAADDTGFAMHVEQSFGNCPKYIRRRRAEKVTRVPGQLGRSPGLDETARAIIASADTFFVASRSRSGIHEVGRVDISHRGGPPGFVTIGGDGDLTVPDYRGNRYFNTLGNLLGDPRAALLFIDFERGDLLQLQGGRYDRLVEGQYRGRGNTSKLGRVCSHGNTSRRGRARSRRSASSHGAVRSGTQLALPHPRELAAQRRGSPEVGTHQ